MKILAISGGRRNSNNDALCFSALYGAEEAGAEVSFIRLRSLRVEHCVGCFACSRSLHADGRSTCTRKDDFDWLREQILEADGVIFSLPVFMTAAPSLFQKVLERFTMRDEIGVYLLRESRGEPIPDCRVLRPRALGFMGVGGSDMTSRFESDCRLLATELKWTTADFALFPWTRSVFAEPEKLERARQLGKRVAEEAASGAVKSCFRDGVCPHCGSNSFAFLPDLGLTECHVCGLQGSLRLEDGRPRLTPCAGEPLRHVFDTADGKLSHTLDVAENNRIRAELMADPAFQAARAAWGDRYPEQKPQKTE